MDLSEVVFEGKAVGVRAVNIVSGILVLYRDHNAAINILKRVGWDSAEYTPVETGVPLTREQPVAEIGSPRLGLGRASRRWQ